MSNSAESLLSEAGIKHWCTKAACTTCGATEFRQALRRINSDFAAFIDAIASMDLAAWYSVENVGGAVGIVFQSIPSRTDVDRILSSWRSRISGHTRLIDAVIFRVVRLGLASSPECAVWMSIARAEALSTHDASLLETLVYALGSELMNDSPLLAAALERRRGYAPLHRAINKTVGHLVAEA